MAYKTILLKGNGEGPLQKEAKAGGAILPGMCVEYVTNDTTIQAHSTSDSLDGVMVAVENSLEGQEVGTTYSTSDQVQFMHFRPGDEFLAFIKTGQVITFGDRLLSNGDGYWKKETGGESFAVEAGKVQALEASAAGNELIKCVAM